MIGVVDAPRLRRTKPPRAGGRNGRAMFVSLVLVTAAYAAERFLGTVTGLRLLDGAVGVVLGLYACSHPAANALDLIFHAGERLRGISAGEVSWFLLNLVVLGVGWLAIVAGATLLVG
jgi:hypothetical protein